MYNQEAMSQFGSAETKLKMLNIKLREAESAQAKMSNESASLRKDLQSLQSSIPPEMADKIGFLLKKMAHDALDNMNEHIKLRESHNLGQIAQLDQRDRFEGNLKACFDLIKQGGEFYALKLEKSQKEQEQRLAALNANSIANQKRKEQHDSESEEEPDEKMDEEELELIKKESMASLFNSFRIGGPKDPKKPAPKKKKKTDDGITEDSFEDEASLDSNEMVEQQFIDTRGHQTGAMHTKNLSIDTDTILRNQNAKLDNLIAGTNT